MFSIYYNGPQCQCNIQVIQILALQLINNSALWIRLLNVARLFLRNDNEENSMTLYPEFQSRLKVNANKENCSIQVKTQMLSMGSYKTNPRHFQRQGGRQAHQHDPTLPNPSAKALVNIGNFGRIQAVILVFTKLCL